MLDLSAPALLFPAVSLLFLSYTNRFLHLAALVRKLHTDWLNDHNPMLAVQISNLKVRLRLIRWMQLLGAASLLLCVISMLFILADKHVHAGILFATALVVMALSLASLLVEVVISGGALRILLSRMEEDDLDR